MIELQVRREDGSVEDRVPIGDRAAEGDIVASLAPLADIYAGTGYTAVLVIEREEERRDLSGETAIAVVRTETVAGRFS